MRQTLAYVWEPKWVEGHDEAYVVFSHASLKLAGQFRGVNIFCYNTRLAKKTKSAILGSPLKQIFGKSKPNLFLDSSVGRAPDC